VRDRPLIWFGIWFGRTNIHIVIILSRLSDQGLKYFPPAHVRIICPAVSKWKLCFGGFSGISFLSKNTLFTNHRSFLSVAESGRNNTANRLSGSVFLFMSADVLIGRVVSVVEESGVGNWSFDETRVNPFRAWDRLSNMGPWTTSKTSEQVTPNHGTAFRSHL